MEKTFQTQQSNIGGFSWNSYTSIQSFLRTIKSFFFFLNKKSEGKVFTSLLKEEGLKK